MPRAHATYLNTAADVRALVDAMHRLTAGVAECEPDGFLAGAEFWDGDYVVPRGAAFTRPDRLLIVHKSRRVEWRVLVDVAQRTGSIYMNVAPEPEEKGMYMEQPSLEFNFVLGEAGWQLDEIFLEPLYEATCELIEAAL
jgi:hypothetical protein